MFIRFSFECFAMHYNFSTFNRLAMIVFFMVVCFLCYYSIFALALLALLALFRQIFIGPFSSQHRSNLDPFSSQSR